jgi:hypothetical protein
VNLSRAAGRVWTIGQELAAILQAARPASARLRPESRADCMKMVSLFKSGFRNPLEKVS